ncbi:hypothetical protein [Streptomyces sp. NRRL WC-3742]|uniref:hypothetical protein n=1 Tax=Streptomyces sp. NRRL WC-3742 TaxID=1463934 RepID=UPI0004CA258C|nr:hypothetical protein [Streptomyces sp. NRRL WC-3742]
MAVEFFGAPTRAELERLVFLDDADREKVQERETAKEKSKTLPKVERAGAKLAATLQVILEETAEQVDTSTGAITGPKLLDGEAGGTGRDREGARGGPGVQRLGEGEEEQGGGVDVVPNWRAGQSHARVTEMDVAPAMSNGVCAKECSRRPCCRSSTAPCWEGSAGPA